MRTTLTVLGFAATQTDEGLIVHNVPIFCACERGEETFDDVWLKAAVTRAFRRQGEGYIPPMHVRHHEPETAHTDSVRAAGHFKITGTSPVRIGGVLRTAIVADLIFTAPDVAHEALNGRLPFRSVEIFDVDSEPSIDSLALLDHEAPFLELPLLKVGQVAEKRTGRDVASVTLPGVEQTSDPRIMVGFARQGNRLSFAFREEPDMAKTEDPNAIAPTDTKATSAGSENFAGDDKDKGEGKNFADDDKKDGETMEADTGLDVSAVVKAIESGDISVTDMAAIMAAVQAQSAVTEPAEDELAPAPAPIESMKAEQKNPSQMAAMQGEIDALKIRDANRDKKDQAREAKDQTKVDVAEAMEQLRGLPMGSDIEGLLFRYRDKHGKDAFTDYVRSLRTHTAVEPGDNTETAANFEALGGKIPDVAMKYQDQGTEAVQQAMVFNRQYDELQAAGSRMRTTRENYIKRNMDKKSA